MAMDPKVKNLIKFVFTTLILPFISLFALLRYFGFTDYFRLIGIAAVAVATWRAGLSMYRRLWLKPKHCLEFGKWAIVTGTIHDTSIIFNFILNGL